MKPLHPSIAHIPMPIRMQRLPLDHRGMPVPYFVGWVDPQTPDHRTKDGRKQALCVREKRCWLCGDKLGKLLTCVIGPMCAINRNTSEPPCHRECALYAVKACPFLTRPYARRRTAGLPGEAETPGGIPVDRNPGVALVWVTRKVLPYRCPMTGNELFTVGDPVEVQWWCEGRHATRAEVWTSIETGLPILEQAAATEKGGLALLTAKVQQILPLLPAAVEEALP